MADFTLAAPDDTGVLHIARNLRRADAQELVATHGIEVDFPAILRTAVLASEEVHLVRSLTGEPIAVFGVAPVSLLGGRGCPWMLGTDGLLRHSRELVRETRGVVDAWGLRYDQLFNFVDARNVRAIAWLKHLGFSVFAPVPYGAQGLPFHRFERCT